MQLINIKEEFKDIMENLTEGILISKSDQNKSDINFKNKEIGKLFNLIGCEEGKTNNYL